VYQRNEFSSTVNWYTYWSPALKFADGKHLCYLLIAMFCIILFAFGFPLVLLMQQVKFFVHKIDFNRIKHVLDQLQGCYKEEYRCFAAYYLLCRQVIYIADVITEFVSASADFYYTDRYLYKYLSPSDLHYHNDDSYLGSTL